jgi:hypothetical protein
MWMRVCMAVVMLLFERVHRHGHYHAAVLYPFKADENVGEVLDAGRTAVDDEYFKAGIEVQVRVTGGNNQVMVLVLRLSELLGYT